MTTKRILIDDIEGIYSFEVDGKVTKVINTGECEEVSLDDIFFELKCSELPFEEINFYLENADKQYLREYISGLSIKRNEKGTHFSYDISAFSTLMDISILNPVLMLQRVAEIAKQKQFKIMEYDNACESPSITIEFFSTEDLVIRDKINSDINFLLEMLKQVQDDFISCIKNGTYYV